MTRSTLTALLLGLVIMMMMIDPPALAGAVPGYRLLRTAAIGAVLAGLVTIAAAGAARPGTRLTLPEAALFGFAGFQWLSSLWSADPGYSLLQGAAYVLMLTAAFAVARRLDFARFLAVCLWSIAAPTLLGVVVAVVAPFVGQESHPFLIGSWRGLANQKNMFGAFSAVLALLSLVLLHARRSSVAAHAPGAVVLLPMLGLALLALIHSNSRGGEVLFLFGAATYFVLTRRLKRRHIILALGLVAILTLVVMARLVEVGDNAVVIYGHEIRSSSRFTIWEFGLRHLADHLLLGYGAGGFWTAERHQRFLSEYGWSLPNFHSGYVTILVEGGVIGTAIFGFFFVSAMKRLVARYVRLGGTAYALITSVVAAYFVSNLFESHLGQSLNPLSFIAFAFLFYGIAPLGAPSPAASRARAARSHPGRPGITGPVAQTRTADWR